MNRFHTQLALLCLALAVGCQSTASVQDAGCLDDAGPNTVCGGPVAFKVAFAGLEYPLVNDAGQPQPELLELFLADHDLSAGCGGNGSKLPTFTGIELQINGYTRAVDAGVYAAPTVSAYELQWSLDGGATILGTSADCSVILNKVNSSKTVGFYSAEMVLPASGTSQLWGDFTAKNCQGLTRALGRGQ